MSEDYGAGADGVILWPEPTCDRCGRFLLPRNLSVRLCPTEDCEIHYCTACGHTFYSVGPVLCKACGGLNWRERQQHRVEMWWFDHVEWPLIKSWRRLRRAVKR